MKLKYLSTLIITSMLLSNCGGKSEEKGKDKKSETKSEEKSEKSENSSSSTEEKSEEQSEKKSSEEEKAVVIAKSGLSLRETSDRKSKLITVLPTNAVVEIVEKGTEDVKI
ncbi:MAG: hypothetical protein EAY69_04140, partial [Cytophagales bacterium]